MKKRIYRYIALALGILAVLSTIGELRLGQIPIVALFLLAGAKQFYDNSVGRVYDCGDQHRFGTQDTSRVSYSSPNHFESLASRHSDYYDPSTSYARGEDPFTRGSINNFD